jgi:hypothetical protein
MPRIILTPQPTPDGRIVLRAEALSTRERLRRLIARLGLRR